MAQSSGKKLIKIDVTADSVCPWCYVGKKNLDKALALSKDQYDFEVIMITAFYCFIILASAVCATAYAPYI